MPAELTKLPETLPEPRVQHLSLGMKLLPLSRRGVGPGLILLAPESIDDPLNIARDVPSSLVEWSEEGFAVAEIQPAGMPSLGAVLKTAVGALKACDGYEDTSSIGMIPIVKGPYV